MCFLCIIYTYNVFPLLLVYGSMETSPSLLCLLLSFQLFTDFCSDFVCQNNSILLNVFDNQEASTFNLYHKGATNLIFCWDTPHVCIGYILFLVISTTYNLFQLEI